MNSLSMSSLCVVMGLRFRIGYADQRWTMHTVGYESFEVDEGVEQR